MGNPYRGEASFEALGKEWTLRVNANALAEFEEAVGVPVTALGQGMGIRQLRAMVWAGLGFHHRKSRGGLETAGLMIDDVGAQGMGEIVMRAISSAYPPPEGGAESPPKAARDETGSDS